MEVGVGAPQSRELGGPPQVEKGGGAPQSGELGVPPEWGEL